MLEVNELHVSYGEIDAVRGVSLAARPGEITLVLGANGAGKTSMLRGIVGLEPVRRGQVWLDGAEVQGTHTHELVRRGLTVVPEGRRVFASLTVEENLLLGGYVTTSAQRSTGLQEMYDLFPILATRRRGQAGLLSGGEQQMLAFGRALMSRAKVVLMDEPSMGLAPNSIEVVLAAVSKIAGTGIAVLMVEQNSEAGLEVADTVVTMTRGKVAFTGSVEEARKNAALIHAFLGESALAEPSAS